MPDTCTEQNSVWVSYVFVDNSVHYIYHIGFCRDVIFLFVWIEHQAICVSLWLFEKLHTNSDIVYSLVNYNADSHGCAWGNVLSG